ncbi:MAG: prepilin peptidase [Rhizobium sp.]|nr:MAG: prepilin peptidase [Rhizobium sp.]
MSAVLIVSLIAFFGACVGSALCVVYRRVLAPGDRPLYVAYTQPRSQCLYCGSPIPFYLNVPLFAWVVLRGKTACCRRPIGQSELWFEVCGLAAGLVVGLWALKDFIHW